MFILNNKPLPIDVPFVHDEVSYPANWLRLSTQEDRNAIGITEVVEQARPDDRFYWVTDNGDGTFTATPKDLEAVRTLRLQEIRTASYTLLAPTDYKFIRSLETGEPVEEATKAKRTAIRAAYLVNETAINAATTVEELADLTFGWPE